MLSKFHANFSLLKDSHELPPLIAPQRVVAAESKSSGPAPNGLSLRYLRQFINTRSICRTTKTENLLPLIIAETLPLRSSFVDLLERQGSPEVGRSSWFISHAWKYSFVHCVEMMERFFQKESADGWEDVIVWFDLFCNTQHTSGTIPFDKLANVFSSTLAPLGQMLIISGENADEPARASAAAVFQPYCFRRSWCIFEYFTCAKLNLRLEIALSEAEESSLNSEFSSVDLQGSARLALQLRSIINLRLAMAGELEDKRNIDSLIEQEVGFDELEQTVFAAIFKVLLRKVGIYSRTEPMCENEKLALDFILNRAFALCHASSASDDGSLEAPKENKLREPVLPVSLVPP